MVSATLTSKGQITVPAEVRAKLKLLPGSRIDFEEQPDGTWKVRPKTRDIRELRGIVKPLPGKTVTIEDMNRAIADAAVARFKRSCP